MRQYLIFGMIFVVLSSIGAAVGIHNPDLPLARKDAVDYSLYDSRYCRTNGIGCNITNITSEVYITNITNNISVAIHDLGGGNHSGQLNASRVSYYGMFPDWFGWVLSAILENIHTSLGKLNASISEMNTTVNNLNVTFSGNVTGGDINRTDINVSQLYVEKNITVQAVAKAYREGNYFVFEVN